MILEIIGNNIAAGIMYAYLYTHDSFTIFWRSRSPPILGEG